MHELKLTLRTATQEDSESEEVDEEEAVVDVSSTADQPENASLLASGPNSVFEELCCSLQYRFSVLEAMEAELLRFQDSEPLCLFSSFSTLALVRLLPSQHCHLLVFLLLSLVTG